MVKTDKGQAELCIPSSRALRCLSDIQPPPRRRGCGLLRSHSVYCLCSALPGYQAACRGGDESGWLSGLHDLAQAESQTQDLT